MTAAVTVPVVTSPEAAARITELGYHDQFEQFLAKVCELVPEVRRIEVTLSRSYDGAFEDGIALVVFRNGRPPVPDPAQVAYSDWKLATFPPEVCLTFSLVVLPEGDHAR